MVRPVVTLLVLGLIHSILPFSPVCHAQSEEKAEFPVADLRAGKDPNKRYFLMGPKRKKTPTKGHGLVLVMPGGPGGADFRPFVENIYRTVFSDDYVLAELVSVKWKPDQSAVWPTKRRPVAGMEFSTEEFLDAVLTDVRKRVKIDSRNVFTLSWSSSGPAAYAISLGNGRVTGSFIAMSVFYPDWLPSLKSARGHPYYLYQSREDEKTPHHFAEEALDKLTKEKAKVELFTYKGGHGWFGDFFEHLRVGFRWLEENRARPRKKS